MEIYKLLQSYISKNIGAVLLTVTDISNASPDIESKDLIAFKLLYTAEEYYSDSPKLPGSIEEILLLIGENALIEGVSKTYNKEMFMDKDNQTIAVEVYAEVYPPAPHLIVAGAGHVAKPVVQLGKMIGMRVTVICDRAQHANREQFPWADEVICKPYIECFKDIKVNKNTFILLLTRGHQYDVMILKEMLGKDMGYLGMIGSRRRISGVFSQLAVEFPEANFENIYAPVGLDLGEETPEEIAVSIIAEIMKIKNKRSGDSLSNRIKYFIRTKEGRERKKETRRK